MRSACALRLLFLLPCVLAAQPDRITAPIDARRTVVLRGNVHALAQPRFDQGPVEPAFRLGSVTLVLKKTDAQQAALEELLQQQQNPASPSYHDWLTPEQYADRFGLSQSDLDQISAWLQSEGFTVEYTARGRNWLAFSGTAGQVRAAFQTEIHRYQVDGEMHFAAAVDPWVPASLEPVVAGFLGLDDFYPKPPRHPLPAYTSGDGTHSLAPDDLAAIYDIAGLHQAGINGAGQSIVIVGQSDINSADIQGFRAKYNLPALNLKTQAYPADPGTDASAMKEADMDLEWAGAVAPNAALIYVYGRNADDAALYAIDNNLAPVISESFGSCESSNTSSSASYRQEAQKAGTLGITWLASSGDSGAFDCDYHVNVAVRGLAVNFPASIPEVTAVGGTEFNEGSGTYWNTANGPNGGSATSYIPEMAWNDTAVGVAGGEGILAGGGGASSLYAKPPWQTGFGVPADGARDVPDVSLTASNINDPYNVLTGGSWGLYGGTSISTPAFAGIVALLSHYLVVNQAQSKPGVGNINPTLYQLAQSVPGVFHDVMAGDNVVPCAKGTPNCTTGQFGYNAGPGYDLATGLGSVDAYNLVTQWNSSLPIPATTATTTTVTASPTSITGSGSTALAATVTAGSGGATPTGSVSFALGGKPLGAANLSGAGAAATASLAVNASQLNAGNNTITATYGGGAGFGASSATVTVNVGAPTGQQSSASMALSSSPSTVALIADYNHCPSQYPYYQQLNLQEHNGYEVQLTRFLSGGDDDSSAIALYFGSWRLAPFGSLQAHLCRSVSNPPKTLAYEVDGTDSAGNQVAATLSVIFQSPANNPGALATSKTSVAMSAGPSQSAAASVNVSLPSGQPWTVSVFPANQKTGWLAVSPLSGTGPAQVNLAATAAGLANGVYTATLIFQSANTTPQYVNVPVTFTIGASSAIGIGGVAHGASYQQLFAPGMLVSVFGTNLATAKQLASTLPLPLTMAGVSATVNGVAAPLLYVSPTQLNIQIPYETTTGTALLAVSNNGLVATYSFPVSASAPGLFTQNQQGSGPIAATSSGSRGQAFALYVTGAGEVSPPIATGAVPAGTQVPVPLLAVSVTIGGVAAHLEYVGIPSWSVGTLQVNFTVPSNAPLGVQPVVVTVGSASSPGAATFTVLQ